MKPYNSDSKIIGYDEGQDFIVVYFQDGSSYTYTNDSAGKQNVDEMRDLAEEGQGLNSFINNVVKYNYSQKN